MNAASILPTGGAVSIDKGARFCCPLCGSQYFTSTVHNGQPQYGHCRGPLEIAHVPGLGSFAHFLGCTFRWDRNHDAAVSKIPEEGN